jgi:hypothetical protein
MAFMFMEREATEREYEPTDWQLEDLDYLVERTYSANWSEMGAYKTTTGLWLMDRLAERLGRSAHTLIVTSKAGKGTYYDAFPKAIPNWELYTVDTRKVHRYAYNQLWESNEDEALYYPNQATHVAVLAHYDVFSGRSKNGMYDNLKEIEWDMIILDEAHRIKNKGTGWTKNLKKLKADNKHVMTGTPFINNPAELWSLLNFLDRRVWGSYWKFREQYCQEILVQGRFRQVVGLKPHMVPVFRTMRASLGPRREMAEVHAGIDHPIEAIRTVELNTIQRRMFNEIKASLSTLDEQGTPLRSPNVLSQLNRLRQITVATPEVTGQTYDPIQNRMVTSIKLVEPSSKLDDVMDILEEIDPQHQVVVFSAFKDPLFLLEARLDKAGITYMHMQQHHKDHERYEMWHDIFPQGKHRVFMSTLALGGESINLTPAKYLIFLDRSWSPKDMKQAVGRIYRPGQDKVPEIIYIDAVSTTDQYVKSKLDIKGKWFTEIFGADPK